VLNTAQQDLSLFSGNFQATVDEKGYLFIDRNGKYFEPILEYLRTGCWSCPSHLDEVKVIAEAEFYGIDLPVCNTTLRYQVHKLLMQPHLNFAKKHQKLINQLLNKLNEEITTSGVTVIMAPTLSALKKWLISRGKPKEAVDAAEEYYNKNTIHIQDNRVFALTVNEHPQHLQDCLRQIYKIDAVVELKTKYYHAPLKERPNLKQNTAMTYTQCRTA
jgi:hypothetical protein